MCVVAQDAKMGEWGVCGWCGPMNSLLMLFLAKIKIFIDNLRLGQLR